MNQPLPGWWLASDGNWYPPETHPDYVPPPPAGYAPDVPSPPLAVMSRTDTGLASAAVLAAYDVSYKGGLLNLPKSKVGKIRLEIRADRFVLLPTMGSKKFWKELTVPYSQVVDVSVVDRTVSTFEGLAGGLDSRQLNVKNNIHVTIAAGAGEILLRLEMLTGVTVMGQAKKCLEFEDRLRTHRVREQFVRPPAAAGRGDLAGQLADLAALRSSGVLTDAEFAAAKARLLGS